MDQTGVLFVFLVHIHQNDLFIWSNFWYISSCIDIPLCHVCFLILFTLVLDKRGLHHSKFVRWACRFFYFLFCVSFFYIESCDREIGLGYSHVTWYRSACPQISVHNSTLISSIMFWKYSDLPFCSCFVNIPSLIMVLKKLQGIQASPHCCFDVQNPKSENLKA